MTKKILAFFLVMTTASLTYATQQSRQWTNLSSGHGQFTVSLPAKPQYKSERDRVAKFVDNTFTSKANGVTFQVEYTDFLKDKDFPRGLEVYAEDVFADTRGGMHCIHWRLLEETEITLNGHPGREFKFQFEDGPKLMRMRIYLVGNRMYTLSVETGLGNQDISDEVERFFESFKLN